MLLTAPAVPGTARGPSLKYHSSGPIPLVPSVASRKVAVWMRPHDQPSGLPKAARNSAPASSIARATIASEVSVTPGVRLSSHHAEFGSSRSWRSSTHENGLPT